MLGVGYKKLVSRPPRLAGGLARSPWVAANRTNCLSPSVKDKRDSESTLAGLFNMGQNGSIRSIGSPDRRENLEAQYMNLTNTSVLIVDSNKNMQNIVRVMLHGFGIKQVHLADDGADALETLRNTAIDVVICDLEMTPIDGLEFLRFLRWSSDSPAPDAPVIILSGQTERMRVIAARDGGAHEFIAKPVSAKVLRARIQSVLQRPRGFVNAGKFKGPDRRRRREIWDGLEKRLGRKRGIDELS